MSIWCVFGRHDWRRVIDPPAVFYICTRCPKQDGPPQHRPARPTWVPADDEPEPSDWPCTNYQPPLTCLSAPHAKSRCGHCQAQAVAALRGFVETAAVQYALTVAEAGQRGEAVVRLRDAANQGGGGRG